MAMPGDPADRPQDTAAVAFSTEDMDHELNRLSMHGMVAWLGKDRPKVEPEVIKKAICQQFAVRPEDVTVVKHFPEDFFCDFKHRHQRDEAAGQGRFPYGNLDIHTRPWQLATHGDICDLKYHVRLCLEGIPLQAWNENIAKRAVARSCDLHYVEQASLDREDTRALCLWAWTHNPSDIPKVTWLTLSCRKAEFHNGPPARGRRGLTFRVLVHLDLVEDPPGAHGRTPPRAYTWRYGVVDGERAPRDRLDPPPSEVRSSNRRDDDDDDDRRGRRGHRDDTWSSRLLRSLSRAPRERERERSESRRGSRRHRSPDHGGRRRPLLRTDAAGTESSELLLERHASETPRRLVTDTVRLTGAVRPTQAPRRPPMRGRSRERTPHRRRHRLARSEPRPRTARSESPQPRLRCKSPDLGGSVSNNRHPSPSPPKVRAIHVYTERRPPSMDSSETWPPPSAPSHREPATPSADALQNITRSVSPSASPPPSRSPVLQAPPRVVLDPAACQREASSILPTGRRFCPGRVYSRRTRAGTSTRPKLTGSGQVLRFRPGFVYSRRRVTGPSVPRPVQAVVEAEVAAADNTTNNDSLPVSQFIAGISQPLPQPLLQVPTRRTSPPQRRKKAMAPTRRSVRIASRCWPKGDTQARARQVLIKKLGILDGEDVSSDDLLLHYFSLFKGPLTDAVIRALSALCGVDAAAAAPTAQA